MSDTRLNLGLQTKLTQKLMITPQMKQSLSLLQMPITELVQEISAYLEENPALESIDMDYDAEIPSDDTPDQPVEETAESSLLEDLTKPEWDEYIADTPSDLTFMPTSDDEQTDFEQFLSADQTLTEHLMFQLRTAGLSDKQVEIGEHIIGNLSEDGYFRADIAEVADECGASTDETNEVLEIIRGFDPAGIASSTLVDCILAQLEELDVTEGECEQIRELLECYASELATFKYEEIERKCGIEKDNLDELLAIIRRTDPRPGLSFESGGSNYILPDAFIVRDGESFDVSLNEQGLPAIRVNEYYRKSLKNGSLDDATREYMEEKVKNAVWILKSLQKRQKAIYKVTKAIVDVQKDYLMMGEAHFKPLRLKDVAEMTGLHESTVSRVTAGKYVMTDHGLLELKSFFSKGMDSVEGDTSTRKIKLMIRSLVDGEPVESPFSDEKLVQLLSSDGVDIARRTVAKYRDEMNIPTMSQRKRMRR